MGHLDLKKEFEKIEERIAVDTAHNRDITRHLRAKVRLLNIAYSQVSDAMKSGKLQEVAPLFAKELAFLNNIKEIQTQINDDISEVEAEIAKVHERMHEKGFGWILENLPEKIEE